jgi:hypothetical protein
MILPAVVQKENERIHAGTPKCRCYADKRYKFRATRDPAKPSCPRLASASAIAVRAQKSPGMPLSAEFIPPACYPLSQLLLDLAHESGLTDTGMSFAD